MEKHKVICPYCGAGCQFNLLVQNGQVVGTEPLNGITNQSELCLKGMSDSSRTAPDDPPH